MAQLPTPIFYLITSTADYNRMALEEVVGGSEYKIFRAELPDYSDEIELYYGMADYYEDSDIEPSTTYFYRALALANGGLDDSEYATFSVTTPASNPLSTPVLTLIAHEKFFTRWSISHVTDAMYYIIERTTEPSFLMPESFVSEELLWEDSGLLANTLYYYRVKAVPYPGNGFTNSDWSDVQTVTTLEYPALPQPTLAATSITADSVDLIIYSVTGGVNYGIYRSIDPSFDTSVEIYYGPLLSFKDTPLIDDTTYYYRVQAGATVENSASPFSETVTATTLEREIPNPEDDPIPGLKYYMSLKDVEGYNWDVRIYFSGWVGSVTQITGKADPLQITFTGFDNDVYENPIMDAKHSINVLNPSFSDSFYDDITNVNDKDAWVKIEREADGAVFSGWLISDEFKRGFDQTVYEISLPVVSPFSIMKNEELLEADLRMMFGSKSIAEVVNRCISSSIHPSLAPRYEIFSQLREKDYVGSLDLFNQLRFFIEAFNDDNGRPPTCYDILEKICQSFKFLALWEDDKVKFLDFYQDARTPKDIKIKEPGDSTRFLIGNSEVISKTRSSKEIGLKYDYGRFVGLLQDGRFLQATNNVLNYWYYFNLRGDGNVVTDYITPRWSGDPTGTVERRGNGRPVNPYRMRFWGEISVEGRRVFLQSEIAEQGLLATTGRLRKNDILSISLRFRYFDWRRKYNREAPNQIDEKVPYLFILILAVPPNYAWQGMQFLADVKNIEGTDIDIIESSSPFPFWAPNLPITGAVTPVTVAVESTTDIQKYEASLRWKFPSDWTLQLSVLGMRWEYGKPVSISTEDLWVDIIDVIVSKQTDVEGYNATGEEIFLTQDVKSSKKEEAQEAFLANFSNNDIPGALLKNDNTASRMLARGGTGDLIQNYLARVMMAQKRSPRYKIDCEYKDALAKPSDLIRFIEGDDPLLPNKYAIGGFEYNVKKAEVRVTAMELNTEDREYFIGGEDQDEPTSTHDMLENYKTYN